MTIKPMRKLFVLLMMNALLATGGSVAAQALPSGTQPSGPENSFFFAYPGNTCPGGSVRYKGPEQALANQSGAVYCKFIHNVFAMHKSAVGEKCPAGLMPYADSHLKPDDDVIWCQSGSASTTLVQKPPLPSKQ